MIPKKSYHGIKYPEKNYVFICIYFNNFCRFLNNPTLFKNILFYFPIPKSMFEFPKMRYIVWYEHSVCCLTLAHLSLSLITWRYAALYVFVSHGYEI